MDVLVPNSENAKIKLSQDDTSELQRKFVSPIKATVVSRSARPPASADENQTAVAQIDVNSTELCRLRMVC